MVSIILNFLMSRLIQHSSLNLKFGTVNDQPFFF